MLKQELEQIIQAEKDIIPFLKKLTPKDKKELVPFLKKYQKKICHSAYEIEETKNGTSYKIKFDYSEKKRDLIRKACYVCFNKTDILKAFFDINEYSVSDDCIENIIPWYKPNWYSDLINENIPWGPSYLRIIELQKKDLLEASKALIINKLPYALIETTHESKKTKRQYKADNLLKHEETLNEHVWFLFEEESEINNYYDYLHLENFDRGNDVWIETLVNFSERKLIDRQKLLIATIYTATKGFNQRLGGWFFDLLIKLEPNKNEILNLQNELFTALNCPHSKIVNTTLKYFKSIATDEDFNYSGFIDNTSILLNFETKSVVNATLMILEKIAKTHKTEAHNACKKSAEALMNVDEKIQLRAANIIDKYGDEQNQDLLDEISLYSSNTFHVVKAVLHKYIGAIEKIETDDLDIDKKQILAAENELPKYETLDELIFFVSQSIDNNEVYHIDLLLSYLPKLSILINAENVSTLEPIFTRAFDLSMNIDWVNGIGTLEREAACYINDFSEKLILIYPLELENFKRKKEKKVKNFLEQGYHQEHYKNKLSKLEDQTISDHIYQVHRKLFIFSQSLIKKGLSHELLSMPTHEPCWIEPKVFISKLSNYLSENLELNIYDFQIAIGRMPLIEPLDELFPHIEGLPAGEYKEVLKYHFAFKKLEDSTINNPELWLQSIITRNKSDEIEFFQEYTGKKLQKELGTCEWDCSLRDLYYTDYNRATGKEEQKLVVKKELHFKNFQEPKEKPKSIISNIKSIFNKTKKVTSFQSIYYFIRFEKQRHFIFVHIDSDDAIKFLYLFPNNPSMFLSQAIQYNLMESTFFDESRKQTTINLLKHFHEIWYRSDYKESSYLFVATGLLCSEKVGRELAAELWITANSNNLIKNDQLGGIIGKLEFGEYAPLKRFTDLISNSLIKISKKHNENLLLLLESMIAKMNEEPIKGLKKLLELYLELQLDFPDKGMKNETTKKIKAWKKVKSLESVITKIEKLS